MTSHSDEDNYSQNPESHQDDDDFLREWVPDPNTEETTIEEVIKALDYEPVPPGAKPNGLLSGEGSVVAASPVSCPAPTQTVVVAPAPATRVPEVARSPATGALNDGGAALAAALEKSQAQGEVSDDSIASRLSNKVTEPAVDRSNNVTMPESDGPTKSPLSAPNRRQTKSPVNFGAQIRGTDKSLTGFAISLRTQVRMVTPL